MIVDAFLFFNELDLLEIRLHELNDIVDLFVLVESSQTFTGKKKRFVFEDNAGMFSEFLPKIKVVHAPESSFAVPMEREGYQRNCMMQGLSEVPDEAIVMVSDVDEIPRATVLKNELFPPRWLRYKAGHNPFVPLHQPMYMYALNGFYTSKWHGTVMMPKWFLRDKLKGDCHKARLSRRHGILVREAGWHFSWLGKADRIIEKVKAYSHQELNNPVLTDKSRIEKRMASGLAYGGDRKVTYVPLDESFPAYVVANQEKFSDIIRNV